MWSLDVPLGVVSFHYNGYVSSVLINILFICLS